MLSGPSFRSAFAFSINSLILPSFSLTCFHLAEASLSAFRGFMLLCIELSKNITKYVLFIVIHILVLILQSTCFIYTSWKHKQTMKQQPHRACERTKSKQKQKHSNWPGILSFDLAHKQCKGIIKEWLHCPISELKGRFLVNNILMFGSAWCLVMSRIQFSLIKKNKDWTSRIVANSHLPTSDIISFLLYPPPKSGSHMCITHNVDHCDSNVKCDQLFGSFWFKKCVTLDINTFLLYVEIFLLVSYDWS